MPLLDSFLHLASTRAQLLIPVLVLGFFLGEYLARFSGLDALLAYGNRYIATLGRKLNRSKRGMATLVYRGIIAAIIILLPAIITGLILTRPIPQLELFTMFLLAAFYGRAFRTVALFRLLTRARKGNLPLELPGGDFLFADTHAVLRDTILTSSLAFAVGIVGTSLWYVVGGLPLVFAYLALAASAQQYRSLAFGWAARSLFQLLDAIPRLITTLLLCLAAIFTPNAHPFAPLRSRHWHGVVARLLGIALGGVLPDGNLPWIGEGTPKPESTHLARWLILRAAASLLLLIVLAAPAHNNLLNLLHE